MKWKKKSTTTSKSAAAAAAAATRQLKSILFNYQLNKKKNQTDNETAIGLFLTGQFTSAIVFSTAHPEVIPYLFAAAVCNGMGQIFVFYALRIFGALMTSTVTTTRKFFTILFSVIFFGHSLTSVQWIGVVLVFGGLSWDIYSKFLGKHRHHHHHHHHHPPSHSHSEKKEAEEKKNEWSIIKAIRITSPSSHSSYPWERG